MQLNQDVNSVEMVITAKPTRDTLENASGFSIGSPDFEKADIQFYNYCSAIEKCGAKVAISNNAKNIDVNKLAVIADSFAIIGNFDKNSAAQESLKDVVSILASNKFLKFITSPGLLDASDVLRAGNQFFIALSDNTNEEGAAQLAFFLASAGYEPVIMDQLKTSEPLSSLAVYLGNDKILIDKKLSKNVNFIGFDQIVVSSLEKGATNSEMINGTLLIASGYTETIQSLRTNGVNFEEVNISELEKSGLSVKSMSLTMQVMKNNISINTTNATADKSLKAA